MASRRTAADEVGEPVARSNQEALKPDAIDDPQAYGTAPASANTGVTPAATTDVQSPNVALPAAPFNALENVGEQHDLVPPPPGEAAHVPEDIQTVQSPNLNPAFPIPEPTSWTASQDPQARFMAALNLSKLRRQAGISSQDEIALAQAIVASPATDGEIAVESRTLTALAARDRSPRQAADARGLVPRAAGQRVMPSLAGAGARPDAPRVQANGSNSAPDPAEFGDI